MAACIEFSVKMVSLVLITLVLEKVKLSDHDGLFQGEVQGEQKSWSPGIWSARAQLISCSAGLSLASNLRLFKILKSLLNQEEVHCVTQFGGKWVWFYFHLQIAAICV